MKIRNGFVSNSSSSSFLIKADGDYKTVYDVAKLMMTEMQSLWGKEYFVDELREIEHMKDKDTPVYFDSSDGGYIRKFKDVIIVSTSQNYNEASLESNIVQLNELDKDYFKDLEYFDEDLLLDEPDSKGFRKIDHLEDFDYYWQQFNDFLLLKSGLYGVWEYDFQKEERNDTRCGCGGWTVVKLKNGEKICGCKATKKYARKMKLEEIENDES